MSSDGWVTSESPSSLVSAAAEPTTETTEQADEFWNARPALQQIRRFAYARLCSPIMIFSAYSGQRRPE